MASGLVEAAEDELSLDTWFITAQVVIDGVDQRGRVLAEERNPVGLITTAGFLGGFVSPLVGMPLVESNATVGFGFWTACFAASAFLILAVRETGVRRRGMGA